MTSRDFNGMIDLIVLVFGVYILCSCLLMKKTGKIRGGILLPKGLEPGQCRDAAGYIAYITPRLTAVGVISVICGITGFLMDYLQLVPVGLYYFVMSVLLIALLWYSVISKKAFKKYWDMP